jgi:hypothetical protein
VPERGHRLRDVDHARFEAGLADVERLEVGEVLRAILQQLREGVQQLPAGGAVHPTPLAFVERVACRRHGTVDRRRVGLDHRRKRALGDRVDDIEGLRRVTRLPPPRHERHGGKVACELFGDWTLHVRLPSLLGDSRTVARRVTGRQPRSVRGVC